MNQSQINFVVKALGADEAAREFAKLERAAKKAGDAVKKEMSLRQYTKTAAGEQQLLALQTKAASARAEQQAGATQRVADATDRAGRAQGRYFEHIARTTVQSALVNQLFLQFVDVAGQAIQQVDLMNNFPATMKSMGQSTDAASESMDTLRNYVGQVGGNLGDATSYVTRFTGAIGDVKSATAVFVGLNNALIAGDSSIEEQRQAAVQFAQALERGKPDMREWRSLVQNMSFQLDQVAKSMGYVNANALGEALTQGEESMAAFTTALTKMSTGTGPIAEQARARMNGMQFSFNVMKNTLVQGLAAIIDTIGRENIVSFFSFLTQVIQVLTQVVITLITGLVTLLNLLGSIFGLPAIKLKKDMGGVADNIGAGAGNAEDLGDGLKDAGDEAKKLNKSLANFDKMNVLPDKTSGKEKDAGAGGAGFDAGQMGELGNLFDGLNADLQEAGKWAKIVAGVIAGLAGIKFAQALLGELGKMTQGFQSATKTVDKLKDAIKNSTSSKDAFKGGQKVGADFKDGMVDNFRGISGVIGGIIGGIAAAVGPAIGGAITAGAAALGVSVGVFVAIIAAAIGAIILIIWTIKENWDTITKVMKDIWEGFTKVIGDLFKGPVDEIKKQWDKLAETMRPVTDKIREGFEKLKEFLAPMFKQLGDFFAPFVKTVQDLYTKYIQPLVDKFKEWSQESGTLMAVLKVLGIILTVVVLAPIALVVAAIGLVVVAIAAIAAAVVWVIAKFVEFANYVISGTMWTDMQNIIAGVGQWIQDKFDEAIKFVQEIFGAIGAWFQARWDEVVAVFTGIPDWFRERFQTAWTNMTIIWSLLGDFFKERWENLKTNLATIGSWFKQKFQEAWDGVVAIWTNVGKWFGDRWTDIKNIFNNVKSFLSEKFQQAWDGIKSIFGNVSEWFRVNVIDRIVNTFNGIKDRITGFFSNVWDGVGRGLKDALNTILRLPLQVPSITVAGKTIGGQTLIPRLARGGLVDQATLAVVGEQGKEAIVPLENNLEWIDKLAAKINTGSSGGSGQPVQIVVQIGEDKVASKVIDLINEKTQMSGRNMIYV